MLVTQRDIDLIEEYFNEHVLHSKSEVFISEYDLELLKRYINLDGDVYISIRRDLHTLDFNWITHTDNFIHSESLKPLLRKLRIQKLLND